MPSVYDASGLRRIWDVTCARTLGNVRFPATYADDASLSSTACCVTARNTPSLTTRLPRRPHRSVTTIPTFPQRQPTTTTTWWPLPNRGWRLASRRSRIWSVTCSVSKINLSSTKCCYLSQLMMQPSYWVLRSNKGIFWFHQIYWQLGLYY